MPFRISSETTKIKLVYSKETKSISCCFILYFYIEQIRYLMGLMTSSNIEVRELLIYAIKSCAGIQVNEALTTRYGLSLPSNPLLSDR